MSNGSEVECFYQECRNGYVWDTKLGRLLCPFCSGEAGE
jgi:hypothetical protein